MSTKKQTNTMGTKTNTNARVFRNDSCFMPPLLFITFLCAMLMSIALAAQTPKDTVPIHKHLQEVVVTGYDIQKRTAVTASVASVETEKLRDFVAPSFDRLLQGRAAGVDVVIPSGLVTEDPIIRVRGINSFSGNRRPLFVVDGVPTASALSFINVNDIASITVLKDGAATALYGSRAAAGVILVTTKKGTNGKALRVEYNNTFGFSSLFRRHEVLDAREFVAIANEKFTNAGQESQAVYDSIGNTNTDWQSLVMPGGAFSHSHNLNFSGASDKVNYNGSVNYSVNQGVVKANTLQRYGASFNLSYKPVKFLNVGTLLNYSAVQSGFISANTAAVGVQTGLIPATLRALPNVKAKDTVHPSGYNIEADGSALGRGVNKRLIEDNFINILYALDKNISTRNSDRIFLQPYVEFLPLKGLSLKSTLGIEKTSGVSFYSLDNIHGQGRGTNGYVSTENNSKTNMLWQNLISYNLMIQQHDFSFIVGSEHQSISYRNFSAAGAGVIDPFFLKKALISNTLASQTSGGSYGDFGLISYFAKLNYAFDDTYFLQASLRQDEQSGLQPAYRSQFFPAISLGWRLSEESFWQGIKNGINEFKLRFSWASTGNAITPGTFPAFNTYSPAPYGGVNGLAFSQFGNSRLTWEKSQKFDVGLDVSLLKNRLSLSLDWYLNQNDGLIMATRTPTSYAIPGSTILRNVGDLEQTGVELAISAHVIDKKDFTWDLDFNLTWQANKINKLYNSDQQLTSSFNINKVGEPIESFYGYDFVGVNSVYGNPVYRKADGSLVMRDVQTGKYTDLSSKDDPVTEQSTIGKGSFNADKDRKVLGSHIPPLYGSLISTFSYKNLVLEFQFRYSLGNKIYNWTRQETLLNQSFANNGKEILSRWQKSGDQTTVPRLYYQSEVYANTRGTLDSRFLEDASFLRLSFIKLTYSFKDLLNKSLRKIKLQNLSLFVQMQNVFILTPYTGIDPENRSASGIDNNVMPSIQTISFGLKVAL